MPISVLALGIVCICDFLSFAFTSAYINDQQDAESLLKHVSTVWEFYLLGLRISSIPSSCTGGLHDAIN